MILFAVFMLLLWIVGITLDAHYWLVDKYGEDYNKVDWKSVEAQRAKTREELRFKQPQGTHGKLDP